MSATLTKKEKKQLRKQMMLKKQELIAKHGSARPGDSGSSGGFRTFADVKPKLPSYTPSAAPTRPSARPKPVIKTVVPPKPAAARKPRVVSPAPAVSSQPSHYAATTYENTDAVPVVAVDGGPGVLQRGAARVEWLFGKVAAGLGAALRWRPHVPRIPWHRMTADATAPGFGTLGTIVWPLRCCGLVAVGGAAKLALEAHTRGASLVATTLVLGMGLAVAVMILALAEIARALKHLAGGVV